LIPKITAYVPAGEGSVHSHYGPLLEKAGVTNKAMIPLGGKPMVQYILEAIDESKHIDSMVIAGLGLEDLAPYEPKKPVEFIEAGNSSYKTILKGIEYIRSMDDPPAYIGHIPSDMPMISGPVIDRILNAIDWTKNYEIYQNWVPLENVAKYYPGVHKKPLKLRGPKYAGGDFYIYQPDILNEYRQEMLEQFLLKRKDFVAIARMMSLKLIIKYVLRLATLRDAGKRFKELFNLTGAFYITDFPEPCIDLDYEEDLEVFDMYCSQPRRQLGENEGVRFLTSDEL
jgi:NDP-sugar pyrophosphorylase family protein